MKFKKQYKMENLLFKLLIIKAIPIPLGWDIPAFLISAICLHIPTTNVVHATSRLKQPKSVQIDYDNYKRIKMQQNALSDS